MYKFSIFTWVLLDIFRAFLKNQLKVNDNPIFIFFKDFKLGFKSTMKVRKSKTQLIPIINQHEDDQKTTGKTMGKAIGKTTYITPNLSSNHLSLFHFRFK